MADARYSQVDEDTARWGGPQRSIAPARLHHTGDETVSFYRDQSELDHGKRTSDDKSPSSSPVPAK